MKNHSYAEYSDNWDLYRDLLLLLDYIICIYLASKNKGLTEDPYLTKLKGLVITDAEVEQLLGEPQAFLDYDQDQAIKLLLKKIDGIQAGISKRRELSRQKGIFLALSHLSEVFGLDPFEEQCIFISLAPELDRKYEKLFAYLQDDINLKFPTVDLVQRLLCRDKEDRLYSRVFFSPDGKLFKYFLESGEDAALSSLTYKLKLKDRVIRFLIYNEDMDTALAERVEIINPEYAPAPLVLGKDLIERLIRYVENNYDASKQHQKSLLFLLWGRIGSGKKLQVHHFCHRFEQKLIMVDLKKVISGSTPLKESLEPVLFEAVLHRAVVCFTHLECLFDEEGNDEKIFILLDVFRLFKGILFLLSEVQWKPRERFKEHVYIAIPVELPQENERKTLWEHFARANDFAGKTDWAVVSNKFDFTPGQIENAVITAKNLSSWDKDYPGELTRENLYSACYGQVHHHLERKATPIKAKYDWEDLILPDEQKQQLQNACNQVRYRNVVYGDWGFHNKLAYGKGLSILFSGPPGTGKTMGAQVIASELMLEIYKIDLSQVISKYIGETEKNLREIFDEAKYSNAILFIDETDALFGKRSEVKDAHDKYANIEVAFLLQKMEEYDGITVLATNYMKNIDEAFLRRIQFIIHFPFPDAQHREKLWRGIFPRETPLADDVDYKYLGKKFEVAGGSIKNMAVYAAFLAAERNCPVGMAEIITAARFEMKKTGKVLVQEEFPEYRDIFI
ncbi:MAG: ATP-binding protein [Syntrophomonas sp.]